MSTKSVMIVGVGGQGLAGWPEELGLAIRDNFAETGHPLPG